MAKDTGYGPLDKRARSAPEIRMGLTPSVGIKSLGVSRRDEKDRRQGVSVTARLLGDPEPGRLERAEALRVKLLSKNRRFKLDNIDAPDKPERKRTNPTRPRATPDLQHPLGEYRRVDPEHRVLEAHRDGRSFYFVNTHDAALCFGGEARAGWIKAIQNATKGGSRDAFGWTWYRIEGRRAKPRPFARKRKS